MKLKKTFRTKSYLICVTILCSMGFYIDLPAISKSKVDRCTDPSISIPNVEAKGCASRAYESADKKLEKVYKQIYSELGSVEKKQLAKAQSTWRKFLVDNCTFEVEGNRGGSGYSIFWHRCLQRMTEARTKELKNLRGGE